MIKLISVDNDRKYQSADGVFVLAREYQGETEHGNPFGGRWVLRKSGVYLGVNQYRYDIAERFDMQLED